MATPNITPLVTVLIATKDRPDDLRWTLHDLLRQDYPAVEMIVIDDGSTYTGLESIVREDWPEAVFVREELSGGCPQRRSEGFLLAKGEYILEIDDDSAPVAPNAISTAVEFMSGHPKIGILSFHIFNGPVLPEQYSRKQPQYALDFVGCGALFRTGAVREVGGYSAFFAGEFEERELALRMLKAGWTAYFFPDVLIHHRVSPLQRQAVRSWMRAFRNKLWAQVMHFPPGRLLGEGIWTLALAAWDSVRLVRPQYLLKGIGQFAVGLPRAIRLRQPMRSYTLRQYDALRFSTVLTAEQLSSPPAFGVRRLWSDYRSRWKDRPRQRSFWDRRPGDTGSAVIVSYAHEFASRAEQDQRPKNGAV